MPELERRMVCTTCLVQYFVESGYRSYKPVCAYCGKFAVGFATDAQIARERQYQAAQQSQSNKPHKSADVLTFPQPADVD